MADRSVSINLRARVAGFVAGMQSAKKETVDLGRKMTETGAYADNFRRKLENATRALPKIEIDADSTPAEIEFARLRSKMESLSSKRIGIDIDAGAARAELAQIERDLSKLQRGNANISVNADIGSALAELRAVDAEISKIDGRTANVNVNADVSGALAGIAAVGAALASLPAAATIGVGVAGLGAAFAAAGAGAAGFAAVALPGLARVNAALKETASAAGGGGGGAGGAMKSAAQSAAEAAARSLRLAEAQDRVADSAAAVKKAQQGVKDAMRGVQDAHDNVRAAQERAGAAASRISEAQAAGARRVADAERSLADAHRATQAAVEDLTRARERAIERIEDLELATKRGALDEEGAQLAIERAKQRLDAINADPRASSLDKREADLAYREALARLEEVRERNGDLAKEKADSDRKGVEGSDEVTAAHERIAEAQRREAEAAAAVGEAQVQAAQDVAAAQREAAEASRDVARARRDVGDAERKVADAQAAVIKAQRDHLRATQRLKVEQLQAKAAMEQMGAAAGGGGGGAASKMAELSKEERKLAEDLQHFKDVYLDWQRSLQPDVFPVISQGLGLMEQILPKLSPLVKSSAAAFSVLLTEAEKALAGPFWNQFLFNLNTHIPGAIIGLGRSFGNVTTGIAGIIDAFLPFVPTVVGGIEDATAAFSAWGQQLKSDPAFHEFILFVQENAPEVWEMIKNVAKAIGNITEALAPMGVGALAGLSLLAELVAGMDPAHIQMIAAAIIAVKLATAGFKVASFFSEMPGRLDKLRDGLGRFGDGFDKAKGKAGQFGDAIGGLGGKLGLLGSTIVGAGVVGGLLILEDRLASNAEAAARFAEKISAMGGGNVDQEIAAVTKAIEEQRAQIGFAILDTVYFSNAEREAADNVEALEARLAELKHAKEIDAIASKAAGDAAGEHGQKVAELNAAMDVFAGRTDAYQAVQNMKKAYEEATAALKASNGELSIHRGMSDEQRDAVLRAREAFSGYITSVKTAADGAKTLSGNTMDATLSVVNQLPELGKLAGKNKEAREQVILLAQAYGVSREDAIKAMTSAQGFKDVLDKIKSKKIEIEAETKKAEAQLQAFIRTLLNIKPVAIPYYLKATGSTAPTLPGTGPRAWGGIAYADGRPDYMAMGGIRELGANPPPMIARRPYRISGRNGPDVVFGEAGLEAYIPLSGSKRGRGMQILEEAAGIMGMAVVPQQMAINGAASTGGNGGSLTAGSIPPAGGASVTLTGIDSLRSALDATAVDVTTSLGEATTTLDATMGDAGSLTSSLGEVGVAAGGIATEVTGLAGEVTGFSDAMHEEVPPLTDAVSTLADAVAAAKEAADGKGDERNPRAGGSSRKGGAFQSASLTKSTKKLKSAAPAAKTAIAGHVGTGSAGIAMSSGGVNWSTTSRPVQGVGSGGGSGSAGASSGSAGGGSAAGPGGRSVSVDLSGAVIREEADINVLVERVGMRVYGRG